MKKAVRKKSTAKKPGRSSRTKQASSTEGTIERGMVDKQPQVNEKAAVANAMFLYTDDAWAQRYFDEEDLRFLEREVFG